MVRYLIPQVGRRLWPLEAKKPLVHHLAAIAALVSLVLREYAKLLSQTAGWGLKLRANEWRYIVSTYSGPDNFLWAPCTAIGDKPYECTYLHTYFIPFRQNEDVGIPIQVARLGDCCGVGAKGKCSFLNHRTLMRDNYEQCSVQSPKICLTL